MPSFLGISTWDQLKESVLKLISALTFWRYVFWNFAGCPCPKCLEENGVDTTREYQLLPEILNSRKRVFKSSLHVNYGNRAIPNWDYFYNMKHEVTVIKSAGLSSYLESIQKLRRNKIEKVDSIHGTLILEGEIKNFIHHKHAKELNNLMKDLMQSSSHVNINIFPLENMIIGVANPYVIGLGRLCGLSEFRLERERLRSRHNKESELLFPIALYEWQENICPDQFEGLTKALLEREPNVKTVRKAAPTNQGDKGRDLLIEWHVRNSNVLSDTNPPTSLIKIVGQCKASTSTVGKSKVPDIRDTVETHNAQGYFLAVSSQISGSLTEKLEDLQAKGIWTEWWNREDIEMRLSKNQDLLPLFPKVVKAKHKVKFVEKE